MDALDYQMADTICETIIQDFVSDGDITTWLSKYKSLYDRFNIAPKGLPAVANCNFEGVKYNKIAKFHSLYHQLMLKHRI